jgi:hypothetical protein
MATAKMPNTTTKAVLAARIGEGAVTPSRG